MRVIDRRFGLYPADKVTRALVAACTAETQQENIVTELSAEICLRTSPEVSRDKASLLENLRGAGDVCDNTRQLLVRIKGEDQLDAVVVAAFHGVKVSGVGVAPHLGCSVDVGNAAAHADSGATELVGIECLGAICPSGGGSLCDLFTNEQGCLTRIHDRIVGGDESLILLIALHELLEDLLRACDRVGVGLLHGSGKRVRGVRVRGGDDELHGIDVGSERGQFFSGNIHQKFRDAGKVCADKDHLLAVRFHRHCGRGDLRLYELRNSLIKLSCQTDFFILGNEGFLGPTDQ